MPAPKTWRTWTRKEDRRLEDLRLDGLTAAAIAVILNRTVPSVKCRIGFLGAGRVMDGRAKWAAVLADPRPIKETAAMMGVGINAVKQAARKLRRAGFDIPFVRKEGKKKCRNRSPKGRSALKDDTPTNPASDSTSSSPTR